MKIIRPKHQHILSETNQIFINKQSLTTTTDSDSQSWGIDNHGKKHLRTKNPRKKMADLLERKQYLSLQP